MTRCAWCNRVTVNRNGVCWRPDCTDAIAEAEVCWRQTCQDAMAEVKEAAKRLPAAQNEPKQSIVATITPERMSDA